MSEPRHPLDVECITCNAWVDDPCVWKTKNHDEFHKARLNLAMGLDYSEPPDSPEWAAARRKAMIKLGMIKVGGESNVDTCR